MNTITAGCSICGGTIREKKLKQRKQTKKYRKFSNNKMKCSCNPFSGGYIINNKNSKHSKTNSKTNSKSNSRTNSKSDSRTNTKPNSKTNKKHQKIHHHHKGGYGGFSDNIFPNPINTRLNGGNLYRNNIVPVPIYV